MVSGAGRHSRGGGCRREGVLEILKRFDQAGIKQCIFSSSANAVLYRFLDKHGIRKYFQSVLGSGDYYVGSKLERTRDYIINVGADPKRTVFIGDMEHDADVARACGGDCILITGGHRPDSVLYSTGFPVVNKLTDLVDLII